MRTFDEISKKNLSEQGYRGNTDYLPPIHRQNYLFTYGAQPGYGVISGTKMIADVRKAIVKGFDRKDLTVRIPDTYTLLVGRDATFE